MGASTGKCFLQLSSFEVLTERTAQLGALQSELDGRFEESELVPGVVALAFVAVAIDLLLFQQQAHCVSELKLSARAERSSIEHFENLWGKNVAADNGEIGRSFFKPGLLDHVLYVIEPVVARHSFRVDHSICGNRGPIHLLCGDDAGLRFIE